MAQIITREELERSLTDNEYVFDRIDAEETLKTPSDRISHSRKTRMRVKTRAIRRPPKRL
jgi:hypothetical protein